jgi:predicted transcriptional regulator
MTKVEINDEILGKIDEIAELWKRSRDEIISDALRDFISENLETTWKEKSSLKKKRAALWEGKIPESEFKPEMK